MDDVSPYLYILLIGLMICSAFFSSAETAFASINRIRLKKIELKGGKKAKKVLDTAEDFERTLSAILIGNNLVNIAAATVGAIIFTSWVGDAGAGLSTVVLTILILLFSEILPKSYAKQHADTWTLLIVDVLVFFTILFSPLIYILLKITHWISPNKEITGESQPLVTEQELKYIIEESHNEGVLEEQESELVQSALDFDDITVDKILTPRVDVVAVEKNSTIEEIKFLFLEEAYSRLPVYDQNIDHIIGVIYFKDFFKQYNQHPLTLEIRHFMQTILYIPPKKTISELMKQLQHLKLHMAVVTDQYGGTIGIVTLEDILEQLVGDIWDESDEEQQEIIELGPQCYQVAGNLSPEDFFQQVGMNYDEQKIREFPNSFAGLALEIFEKIPKQGDCFIYENLKITVSQLNDQRIIYLLVESLKTTSSSCDYQL